MNGLGPDDLLRMLCWRPHCWKSLSMQSGWIRLTALYAIDDWENPYKPPMEILYIPTMSEHKNLPLWISGWHYRDGEAGALTMRYGPAESTLSEDWTRWATA
jgi:hypothetical protein